MSAKSVLHLLTARQVLGRWLTARQRYQLWFPMLALLTLPLIPLRLPRFSRIFSWLRGLGRASGSDMTAASENGAAFAGDYAADRMQDFATSVKADSPFGWEACYLLFGFWAF